MVSVEKKVYGVTKYRIKAIAAYHLRWVVSDGKLLRLPAILDNGKNQQDGRQRQGDNTNDAQVRNTRKMKPGINSLG